jgi:hypothetical protein
MNVEILVVAAEPDRGAFIVKECGRNIGPLGHFAVNDYWFPGPVGGKFGGFAAGGYSYQQCCDDVQWPPVCREIIAKVFQRYSSHQDYSTCRPEHVTFVFLCSWTSSIREPFPVS